MEKLFNQEKHCRLAGSGLGGILLLSLGIIGYLVFQRQGGLSHHEITIAVISAMLGLITLLSLRLYSALLQHMKVSQQKDLELKDFGRAVTNNGCAVLICSEAGRVSSINQRFSDITGYAQAELGGWHIELLNPAEGSFDPEQDQIWVRSILQDGWQGEILTRHRDGQNYWMAASVSELRDANNGLRYIISCIDIHDLKSANTQMKQLALYDSLTGLANRRLFVDRLEQNLKAVRRDQRKLGLMFLDLDQFKRINDTLGHDAGDCLLKTVADRLRNSVRQKDTVSRLGGDEFTVLLTDIDDTLTITHIADKILHALKEPIMLGKHEVIVSTSIGITIAPDDGCDADTLMKNADLALYKAKEKGRDCHHYFTEELNARALRQLMLEQELRHALHHEEFSLDYQPQVSLKNGEIQSVEALLRWQHPHRGRVAPGDFVPVAEECGLIVPIGKWVLRNACLQIRMMQQMSGRKIRVAVNLSARQFEDPELVDYVRDVLAETQLPAESLELEVTESMLMGDMESVISKLQELKAAGVVLTIDDFGSGYSSLSYLKRLPVDILKVDRQFVKDIPEDLNDMEITSAVIAVAHKLNLKVVAEGVEDEDQRDFLMINRCDYAQGYLFSKPISLEALYPYLNQDDRQSA